MEEKYPGKYRTYLSFSISNFSSFLPFNLHVECCSPSVEAFLRSALSHRSIFVPSLLTPTSPSVFTPLSPRLHPVFTSSSPRRHPFFTPTSPRLHPYFTPPSPLLHPRISCPFRRRRPLHTWPICLFGLLNTLLPLRPAFVCQNNGNWIE